MDRPRTDTSDYKTGCLSSTKLRARKLGINRDGGVLPLFQKRGNTPSVGPPPPYLSAEDNFKNELAAKITKYKQYES